MTSYEIMFQNGSLWIKVKAGVNRIEYLWGFPHANHGHLVFENEQLAYLRQVSGTTAILTSGTAFFLEAFATTATIAGTGLSWM